MNSAGFVAVGFLMTCKALSAVKSTCLATVLLAFMILLSVDAASGQVPLTGITVGPPTLPTIDLTNRVRAHGPAPDPYAWCGVAPTGGVVRTHGWLLNEFRSDRLVGEFSGTNRVMFLFAADRYGTNWVSRIVPMGIPQGKFGFVVYCEFPRATWYTVSRPMHNGDLFVYTNSDDFPIGFYEVRSP